MDYDILYKLLFFQEKKVEIPRAEIKRVREALARRNAQRNRDNDAANLPRVKTTLRVENSKTNDANIVIFYEKKVSGFSIVE